MSLLRPCLLIPISVRSNLGGWSLKVLEIFLIFVASMVLYSWLDTFCRTMYIEFLYSYIGGLAEFEWLAAGKGRSLQRNSNDIPLFAWTVHASNFSPFGQNTFLVTHRRVYRGHDGRGKGDKICWCVVWQNCIEKLMKIQPILRFTKHKCAIFMHFFSSPYFTVAIWKIVIAFATSNFDSHSILKVIALSFCPTANPRFELFVFPCRASSFYTS